MVPATSPSKPLSIGYETFCTVGLSLSRSKSDCADGSYRDTDLEMAKNAGNEVKECAGFAIRNSFDSGRQANLEGSKTIRSTFVRRAGETHLSGRRLILQLTRVFLQKTTLCW